MGIIDYDGTVVAAGDWLYDGSVRETVEIVAFDYDFWFELPGHDGRPEWEPYPLNSDGLLYYVRNGAEPLPMKPFTSLIEAKHWIETQPWAPVTWRTTPKG